MRKISLLILLAPFMISRLHGGNDTMSTTVEEQFIWKYASLFTEKSAQENASSILSKDLKTFDFDKIDSDQEVVWVKFALHNPLKEDVTMYTSTFFCDSVSVYEKKNNGQYIRQVGYNGYLVRPEQRAVNYSQSSVTPIQVPKNSSTEYLLRIRNHTESGRQSLKTSLVLGLVLYNQAGFDSTYGFFKSFNLFLMGLISLTILYNVLLFIFLRDQVFGLLVFYNLAAASLTFILGGVLIDLNLVNDLEIERLIRRFIPFNIIFYAFTFFGIVFLNTKRHTPVIHWIMISLAIIHAALILLFLVDYQTAIDIQKFVGSMIYPLMMVSAIVATKNKQPQASFFLVGTLAYLLLVPITLYIISSPNHNYLVGHMMLQGLITFEILIFTFASTRRMGIIKNISERALEEKQAIALELEDKNRKLIAYTTSIIKSNDELEEIRRELRQSNNHSPGLAKRLDQLKNVDASWETFRVYFENVYSDFFGALHKRHENLTANEERLAAFIKMGLTSKEIASLQNVTKRAIDKARERLKKKMELNADTNLTSYIKQI